MKRAIAVTLLLMLFASLAFAVGSHASSFTRAKKPKAGIVQVADGPDLPPATTGKPPKPAVEA